MPRSLHPAILACGLIAIFALPAFAAGTLTITCLDVGQGDATLIQSPSGKTLLFDGGKSGRGEDIIVPYLAAAGIDTLDYIVASHYHADHIGGIDEVLAAVPVRFGVYDRGWSYTTLTYNSYVAAAGSQRQTLAQNQVFDLGEGVTVTCVALNGNGQVSSPYNSSSRENEYDVCLKIEYGGFDYFQAGDLTGNPDSGYDDIETSVGPLVGDIDVYHVSHHGSYSSSNAAFLTAVQAEVSVISLGSNSYGHPHQSVLNRLQSFGSFVYQTETGSGGTLPAQDLRVVGGHVVITTDGITTYDVSGDAWQIDEDVHSTVPEASALLTLQGVVPNPFNPTAEIRFSAGQAGPGSLSIHDISGRLVVKRVLDVRAGDNAIRWSGRDAAGRPVPAGVYLYTVRVPGAAAVGRMTMVK